MKKLWLLANNCDKRLQQLEQRDFMAKGLSFIERVKNFLPDEAWADTNKRISQLEIEIFRVSDGLKEIQEKFGGED